MALADPPAGMAERISRVREALLDAGFAGDFENEIGARHVAATDNSIYEILPAAIAYPAHTDDVALIILAAGACDPPFSITARGGDTGTNGQSLNDGIIIDFARHMNRIIALDAESGTVTVEPGVVLGQLNAALAAHDLFFPPNVSTASRATIGGMIATDASGKGSRRYGKTSDYILALDVVLSNGDRLTVKPMQSEQAATIAAGMDRVADIHREALRIVTDRAVEIDATFPKMNRGLTGYNLQKAYDHKTGRFSLVPLLAGSEGTLAITVSATIRVARRPSDKKLVVIRYDSVDAALRDVSRLVEADPLAIEILDDKVLGVARHDVVWHDIETLLGTAADAPVGAISFVEFADEGEHEISSGIAKLNDLLADPSKGMLDYCVVAKPVDIATLWSLREKAVGLLARLGGGRQGIPFVEDTAVPPNDLADFVAEFRDLLDGHGLQYGMFGHADVGCLHVRPFIDMKNPKEAALIRPISDAVARLTKRYGGLLWGEHGRGFRGEYSPLFFGESLYPELVSLKTAFDPKNLFNPGKLAAPTGSAAVTRIDEAPFRGSLDRRIGAKDALAFDRAIACNGNAACYSWDMLDVMCPSFKATRDRTQSPKGRAVLLRAWARSAAGDASYGANGRDIEKALLTSLSTCLSCKACTTLCPVQVDVPTMKSRFLDRYYKRHARPLRHHLIARLETSLRVARRIPTAANAAMASPLGRMLAKRILGLVDLPRVSTGSRRLMSAIAEPRRIATLSTEERARTVIIVEDSFTTTFDLPLQKAAVGLLEALGYSIRRLPARENGKALHVIGMRDKFAAVARREVARRVSLEIEGVRLVGLDAATSLMHEQEYREFVPNSLNVVGLERFLSEEIAAGRIASSTHAASRSYRLLGHCSETALRPAALRDWSQVLAHFGIVAEPVSTGCCGMAGLFGHEETNVSMSRHLFDLSWRPHFETDAEGVLATGFSCRCQSKRVVGIRPPHPVELLFAHVEQGHDL